MAICNIAEDPTQSTEQFEQIQTHLRRTGPVPPEGARLVLAGQTTPGRRVITVWDSREARDAFFAERLGRPTPRRDSPSSVSSTGSSRWTCWSPATSPGCPRRSPARLAGDHDLGCFAVRNRKRRRPRRRFLTSHKRSTCPPRCKRSLCDRARERRSAIRSEDHSPSGCGIQSRTER
jgi:hypothetical protein